MFLDVCDKDDFQKDIATKKKLTVKFSLSTDEYSSVRGKRYLNINIHSDCETYNLGLIRLEGTIDFQKLIECVQNHLIEFELKIEK